MMKMNRRFDLQSRDGKKSSFFIFYKDIEDRTSDEPVAVDVRFSFDGSTVKTFSLTLNQAGKDRLLAEIEDLSSKHLFNPSEAYSKVCYDNRLDMGILVQDDGGDYWVSTGNFLGYVTLVGADSDKTIEVSMKEYEEMLLLSELRALSSITTSRFKEIVDELFPSRHMKREDGGILFSRGWELRWGNRDLNVQEIPSFNKKTLGFIKEVLARPDCGLVSLERGYDWADSPHSYYKEDNYSPLHDIDCITLKND